jgi:hypothetical protein
MSTTVNLQVKACANQLNDSLNTQIQQAISKSCCRVVGKLNAENGLQFQIKALSDKLEKLSDELSKSGINLTQEAASMLKNASTQYSVFRDIEITLSVQQNPTQAA